jgi:hypothetical protein
MRCRLRGETVGLDAHPLQGLYYDLDIILPGFACLLFRVSGRNPFTKLKKG